VSQAKELPIARLAGVIETPGERFVWLEDSATDFPFYRGEPVAISGRQWLFVMAMVVVGSLASAWPIQWPAGIFWQFVPAALMLGLPLLALAYVAPGHWKAIFGRVHSREVMLMFGFALLTFDISGVVAALVFALASGAPNGVVAEWVGLDTAGRVALLAEILPQLIGEEVITILPFLALLQWLSRSWGIGRKGAVISAWLITSVIFGLLHLATYDWHWIQCIVVIGAARAVLTLPWILTKNIWVSAGAHITNDCLLLGVALWS
jgi:hypothetical protein